MCVRLIDVCLLGFRFRRSLSVPLPSPWESHGVTVLVVDMSTAALLSSGKDEESEKKDEMDDDTMFTTLGEEDKSKPFVAPRWATRVFAADCLCRIINLCENADQAHFDLAMARSAKLRNPKSTCQITSFTQSILICVRFPVWHTVGCASCLLQSSHIDLSVRRCGRLVCIYLKMGVERLMHVALNICVYEF